MTLVVMASVLIVGAVAQAQLPGFVLLAQARFPFLLSIVLYYALNRETGTMLATAFLAGLLQDALSPVPLGYSTALFCAAGWLASRFRRLVITESPITPVFFGSVAGSTTTLALYAMLTGRGLIAWPLSMAIIKALGTGLLATATTPLVFVVAGLFDRVVGNVEGTGSLDDLE